MSWSKGGAHEILNPAIAQALLCSECSWQISRISIKSAGCAANAGKAEAVHHALY
jgi:hypothetical protein